VRLDWPNCLNARDLGGLPTGDGRRIRSGALIRTDRLSELTPAGVQLVRDHGVSRIIDLRTIGEVEESPGPFAGDPILRHVSFIDETVTDSIDGETLIEVYRQSLERNGRSIAAAFDAMVSAPPGGVLVHCHAGKDRTGVLVALALQVSGVPDDEIVADYALSGDFLRAVHEAYLATLTDEQERTWADDMRGCRAETMADLLSYLDDRHGGARSYLSSIGVGDDSLAALRRRLVVE
jgi:protein-tyrosine phosphatase